jgi:hypothetical protein
VRDPTYWVTGLQPKKKYTFVIYSAGESQLQSDSSDTLTVETLGERSKAVTGSVSAPSE